MRPEGAAGLLGLMPVYRRGAGGDGGPGAAFGLKAICVFPGNAARGMDAHQGFVVLFDGETGEPRALLNASAITAIRTAAASAVATRLLAREDARDLAIVGAGVQARAHLEALACVRGIARARRGAQVRERAQVRGGGAC